LFVANAAVRAIAFRHIDRFLSTRWNDATRRGIDLEQEISVVRRSIARAANIVPWKSLCLSRSITEFIMLRRRGIVAAIFTGVQLSGPSSLEAHAWVDAGLGANDMSSAQPNFTTVIRIGAGAIDR
jgi:hypothetical protein